MGGIIEPKEDQLRDLVSPYLNVQPKGLGFALGYASQTFANYGRLYFAGNVQNQFGSALRLTETTPFEIASISKTFTSTLYTLLFRSSGSTKTIGDYIIPNGRLPISPALANITLDQLVNYTSGLPTDNSDGTVGTPRLLPQPYSLPAMLSFLNSSPPTLTEVGTSYTYSNLAFAIMSAIIASDGTDGAALTSVFTSKMRDNIFKPLGLNAMFFDDASLADLPLGFSYGYWPSPAYATAMPGWPFFPAYLGAGGIVATPLDVFHWLLFNMGIMQNETLTPLLPALQTPSTLVKWNNWNQLGLGWFINPAGPSWSASIWKDGGIDGFSSYIAFLPSTNPGKVPSRAGAFALVNADGITDTQTSNGVGIAAALANDLLQIMLGNVLPPDKSIYPRSVPARAI
jgi:D-alanyl-D-alanine-carboxypeptidase/D-alanyl-D-alanine-endopeptidase